MRRWLDLAIGLIAILLPAVLLLADQVAAIIPPYHHIKITPGLTGVTLPVDPEPSLARVLDGAWQGETARMIGSRTPLYPFAVRLKDEIMFSVFGLSGIPGIMVGRGGALIERSYAEEYCSRDLARFLPLARAWAPKLRQMQDAYEQRGKTFPVCHYPVEGGAISGPVAAGLPVPGAGGRPRGLASAWRNLLTAAGVHFVDTTIPLVAAQGRYPFTLYPRGGTHWNSVGAALATNAIAAGLDRLRKDAMLPAFAVTWRMMPRPIWPDDDLGSLMNLLVKHDWGAAPQAILAAPPPPGGCRRLAVAIVGGSFMNRPAEDLAQGPCAPHVEEWQYWTVFDIIWPPGVDGKTGVDPAERDAGVLSADVLLYEENEQLVARSDHGPALYAFLRKAWGLQD